MAQRPQVARALTVSPRYLICDELSSMLDVSTQAALLEAIAGVQEERELGVLLITHDTILARSWCEETVDIRELAGEPAALPREALTAARAGEHPGTAAVADVDA